MSMAKLEAFPTDEIDRIQADGALYSLHMKATMMKVSDPILFGPPCAPFQAVLDQHGTALEAAGVNFNNGLGDLVASCPACLRWTGPR